MKIKQRYFASFVLLIVLQAPTASASRATEPMCCQNRSERMATTVSGLTHLTEALPTGSNQVQFLFGSEPDAVVEARERRTLLPLFASGFLALLAFVRI